MNYNQYTLINRWYESRDERWRILCELLEDVCCAAGHVLLDGKCSHPLKIVSSSKVLVVTYK